MHVIHSRQQTPAPVHLRVVARDLREHQEEASQRHTQRQRRDQRVRRKVHLLQRDDISPGFLQRRGQQLQLRNKREHRLLERYAVRQ